MSFIEQLMFIIQLSFIAQLLCVARIRAKIITYHEILRAILQDNT